MPCLPSAQSPTSPWLHPPRAAHSPPQTRRPRHTPSTSPPSARCSASAPRRRWSAPPGTPLRQRHTLSRGTPPSPRCQSRPSASAPAAPSYLPGPSARLPSRPRALSHTLSAPAPPGPTQSMINASLFCNRLNCYLGISPFHITKKPPLQSALRGGPFMLPRKSFYLCGRTILTIPMECRDAARRGAGPSARGRTCRGCSPSCRGSRRGVRYPPSPRRPRPHAPHASCRPDR